MSVEHIKIKINSLKNSSSLLIDIISNDTYFTEKIIEKNIQIKNLKYKLSINLIDNLNRMVKSKFMPTNPLLKAQNLKEILVDFNFNDSTFEINNLDKNNVYRVTIQLVEAGKNEYFYSPEIIHKNSNVLIVNTIHGEINQDKINQIHQIKHKKKIFCNSEKDAIKIVNNEIVFQELDNILPFEDIKSLTMENRIYKNIENFTNSNYKFSKKMTEERKKKIIYKANSQIYFEEKMIKNGIDLNKNKFLNNEWFMGPIYSYDNNYKNFI